MVDSFLLQGLRKGSEKALSQVIDKYTSYVCVIIRNAAGNTLSHEDIEEIASDVFLACWDNAGSVNKLKPYLAATARNKAINKLRQTTYHLPIEEGVLPDCSVALDEMMISKEQRQILHSAILDMEVIDREIFIRHYYDSQSVSDIAREICMSYVAVKQRLSRGRKKLKLMIGENERWIF